MNSIAEEINSVIKNAIEEYVQLISSKYEQIKLDDLEDLWNDVSKTMQISVSFKKTPGSSVSLKKNSSSDGEEETIGCPYKYIKGAKKDQNCGAKAKAGSLYCSRHKKHEGSTPIERTTLPVHKKDTVKPQKSKSRSPAKSVQRVLRKNKTLGKLWHPESGIVFRSANERIAIGKCVDDKLIDLTKDDIDECRKWGFSFVANEESNKSSDGDGDGEVRKSEFKHISTISNSSKKFWDCTVIGVEYTTKHGKIGKEGTTNTKTFDSHADALEEMDRVLKSKLKKGYVHNKEGDANEKVEKVKSPNKKTRPISPSCSSKKSIDDDDDDDDDDSLTEIIDELQGVSSDKSDEDEDEKILGNKFIHKALGITGKSQIDNVKSEDEDEDEEFLIDEIDEDE